MTTGSVLISGNNVQFLADEQGAALGGAVVVRIVAHDNLCKVTPQIGEITGAPEGMEASALAPEDHEIPVRISVRAGSALGGSKGCLSVPVAHPVATVARIYWKKTAASPSAGDRHHAHTQAVPESVWDIAHNLGKFPAIEVVDSSGNRVFGDAQYVSEDRVVLRFSGACSGRAFCN